eukprot:scaffold232456_cov33-Tisochrysis_lutea.AAC.7
MSKAIAEHQAETERQRQRDGSTGAMGCMVHAWVRRETTGSGNQGRNAARRAMEVSGRARAMHRGRWKGLREARRHKKGVGKAQRRQREEGEREWPQGKADATAQRISDRPRVRRRGRTN